MQTKKEFLLNQMADDFASLANLCRTFTDDKSTDLATKLIEALVIIDLLDERQYLPDPDGEPDIDEIAAAKEKEVLKQMGTAQANGEVEL